MAEAYMPLYVPIKNETVSEGAEPVSINLPEDGDYKYIMCMWKVKNPLYPEPDFCVHASKDFPSLIKHLKEEHNACLEKNVDYCLGCQILFDSPLQGIHHYLSKTLNFEDFDMVRDNPACNGVDLKIWLGPIFDRIKGIRAEVMDKIIYKDMPPLEDEAPLVIDECQSFEEAAEGTMV